MPEQYRKADFFEPGLVGCFVCHARGRYHQVTKQSILFTVIIIDKTQAVRGRTGMAQGGNFISDHTADPSTAPAPYPQIAGLKGRVTLRMTPQIASLSLRLTADSQNENERRRAKSGLPHSHSIVPGGFDVMSYTTRLIPLTSFTMRLEMVFNTSWGRGTQSAVIPSSECTARTAQV